MLLPSPIKRAVPRRSHMLRAPTCRAERRIAFTGARLTILFWVLACATGAQGAGGKVLLARKYRSGQAIIYATSVRTSSRVDSDPPSLKNFFPPMPADMRLNQQSTVTVSKVALDGAADVQHRFDKFAVQADLGSFPENIRDSITQAQQEVSQRMVGQTLTAHYDHDGRLVDIAGADDLFQDIDAPIRDPLLQMLRLFMEQMGGQSVYPDHPVKVGEEWSQKLDAQPIKDYPFQVRGKNTLHYSGKTRYQGVKAAILDYQFENTLTPAVEGLRQGGALPQLQAMGIRLDIQINGKGQGRMLVALDDGRVLQNHSTLHQTLRALMKSGEGFRDPTEHSPRLEIQSETEMQVDGNKP